MKWPIALMFVTLAASAVRASGQRQLDPHDFCALRISVTDSELGLPINSALAELIDPSGRVVQTEEVVRGRVNFCDFSFGRYSVIVRDKRSDCLATEIKNVHVIYGMTQNLHTVLNPCPDAGDGGGNACFIYVRVTSPAGLPIKGATIEDSHSVLVDHTDSYGRAQVAFLLGTTEDFTVLSPGYNPQHIPLSCASAGSWSDAPIILRPEPPAR
jgi:hypothetical protein